MDRQRGSILVLTVLTVAVLMIVGVSFLSLASAELLANSSHADRMQAFFEAEAGLVYGKQHVTIEIANIRAFLSASTATPNVYTVPNVPLVDKTTPEVVVIEVTETQWILQSTAQVRRARQVVKCDVTVPAYLVAGGSDAMAVMPPEPPGTPPMAKLDEDLLAAAPSYIAAGARVTLNLAGTSMMTTPYYINEIGGNGNITINLNTNGGFIDIYIREFSIQGASSYFNVNGGGTVRLMVMDSFSYVGNPYINRNQSSNRLLIYPWDEETSLTSSQGTTTVPNSNRRNYKVNPSIYARDFIELSPGGIIFSNWSGN